MQTLKTIALGQVTANTLQRLKDTANTFADEELIVLNNIEFIFYKLYFFGRIDPRKIAKL